MQFVRGVQLLKSEARIFWEKTHAKWYKDPSTSKRPTAQFALDGGLQLALVVCGGADKRSVRSSCKVRATLLFQIQLGKSGEGSTTWHSFSIRQCRASEQGRTSRLCCRLCPLCNVHKSVQVCGRLMFNLQGSSKPLCPYVDPRCTMKSMDSRNVQFPNCKSVYELFLYFMLFPKHI